MFKILIIDDTKSVHAYLKNLLAKAPGIETVSVMNGAEAVSLLADQLPTDPHCFDTIFLDWEMPVMNGPETFAEFLKMKLAIPVVMMTTKNSPDEIGLMLGMGVSEYMMKPFTIDILFEKIEMVTGQALPYAA